MNSPFYARSMDDLPNQAQVLSLSGLEFMQAILSGAISNPPIGQTLGYRVDHVEDGRVVFRGTPTFDALNPMEPFTAAGTARFWIARWPVR